MSIEDLITYGTRRERRAVKKANKSFRPKNKRPASMKPKREGRNDSER